MTSLLDRYVGRVFASSWVVSFALFVGLFGVVDFFAKIEDFFGGHHEGSMVGLVAQYYAASLPQIFVHVAPFVMLMAALFSVTRLRRRNEYTAMMLVGRSPRRVLMPVFVLSGVAVLGLVAVQQVVVPPLSDHCERLKRILLDEEDEWLIPSVETRDAQDKLFSFRDFDSKNGTVGKVTVSFLDEQGFNHSIEGEGLTYEPGEVPGEGGWRLQNGTHSIQRIDADEKPEVRPVYFIQTDLRPDDLRPYDEMAFELSMAEVIELSDRYPLNRRFRMLRHYHVTHPLSVLLLVLLGVPLVLRGEGRSVWIGLGLSISLCLGFLVMDMTLTNLGTRGFLSPALAAWLPVVVAGSLATILLDAMAS